MIIIDALYSLGSIQSGTCENRYETDSQLCVRRIASASIILTSIIYRTDNNMGQENYTNWDTIFRPNNVLIIDQPLFCCILQLS